MSHIFEILKLTNLYMPAYISLIEPHVVILKKRQSGFFIGGEANALFYVPKFLLKSYALSIFPSLIVKWGIETISQFLLSF